MLKPTYVGYSVIFTPSCKYDLGNDDQLDINKIFGIGYFPGHQRNSIRFGWNYSLVKKKIQLFAYGYADGKRDFQHIQDVAIGQTINLEIKVSKGMRNRRIVTFHEMWLNGRMEYFTEEVRPSKIGYLLRPWFGGNQYAPHDIWIVMKKIGA
jgi:hypothetical protein